MRSKPFLGNGPESSLRQYDAVDPGSAPASPRGGPDARQRSYRPVTSPAPGPAQGRTGRQPGRLCSQESPTAWIRLNACQEVAAADRGSAIRQSPSALWKRSIWKAGKQERCRQSSGSPAFLFSRFSPADVFYRASAILLRLPRPPLRIAPAGRHPGASFDRGSGHRRSRRV